jgi:sortase A
MRKRLSTILVLAGSAALVWCATVWTGAALFEKYQARQWNPPAAATVPVSRAARAAPVPLAPPKLHDVIAWIEIPRLSISTAVLEGDDDVALDLGAGHIPGTALPSAAGNIGIAAHRDSFFRSLGGIEPNDRIRLRTQNGDWDYTVESTRIVKPSEVGVLANSSQPELTLVTCYPFHYVGAAPLRFIVRARRALLMNAENTP